jgi:para-nitrobenzyl esterase
MKIIQQSFFTLLLTICLSYTMLAQNHATCDGTRYISTIFTTIDTTQAVLFGNNTTIGGTSQDLFMDIYEPNGDMATERPVIILAFGGSFIQGTRQALHGLCMYYASRGFVAVTIDYRLFDIFAIPNAAQMEDVVIKAVSDMKAAIRFLREDAATTNMYKVDPDLVFVGGISAGAIVANHVAYVDSTDVLSASVSGVIASNGSWTGNSSTNTQYPTDVQGVVNFSGALADANYIGINSAPLFSVHDDQDGTVPYNGAMAVVFSIPIIYMEGSGIMHPRAALMGVSNELITIPNSTGHVSYFQSSPVWQDSVQAASCKFLHDNVICPMATSVNQVEKQQVAVEFYPNPSDADMTIQFEDLPYSYSIAVYDNMGRQVYQEQAINENRYTLKNQNFVPGVYYINIQFEQAGIAPIQSKVVFR